MYQVIINNIVVKEYKHKIQAIIYLWMHGYVYYGKGSYWFNNKCKIRKIK